jgi:hypothetical protein
MSSHTSAAGGSSWYASLCSHHVSCIPACVLLPPPCVLQHVAVQQQQERVQHVAVDTHVWPHAVPCIPACWHHTPPFVLQHVQAQFSSKWQLLVPTPLDAHPGSCTLPCRLPLSCSSASAIQQQAAVGSATLLMLTLCPAPFAVVCLCPAACAVYLNCFTCAWS